jgi:hypothetical protein
MRTKPTPKCESDVRTFAKALKMKEKSDHLAGVEATRK